MRSPNNAFSYQNSGQFRLLLIITVLFWVTGCSTATSSFNKTADRLGYSRIFIQGKGFSHAVFENTAKKNSDALNVYLGGDGTPWFEGRYATRDPTPLKPVMLDLMKTDRNPAIYLGRPCYHYDKMPATCNKSLWTHRRYSDVVVQSMVVALERYMKQHNYHNVKLFGFSGGGALAMLMASRLDSVRAVVTIAGNLDTDAWTTHHNYLPLVGSLNPAKAPPLPSYVQQVHIAGGLDKSVPAKIIEKAVTRQKNALFILLENADHHCCWKAEWPKVLQEYH